MLASSLGFTRHAEARCQQRSIPRRLVELVVAHANRRVFVGDGVQAAMITRKRLQTSRVPQLKAERDRLDGLMVLFDPQDGTIVTAMWADGAAARRYRARS
ncbi:MAG: hypothetical protein JNJ73_21655 [Hyphomonadaceae bacterium]|nr:hypothetical protein [Hyphomonadaceae bacterium]